MAYGNTYTPTLNSSKVKQNYPPPKIPVTPVQSKAAVKKNIPQSPGVTGWPTRTSANAQNGRQMRSTATSGSGNPSAGPHRPFNAHCGCAYGNYPPGRGNTAPAFRHVAKATPVKIWPPGKPSNPQTDGRDTPVPTKPVTPTEPRACPCCGSREKTCSAISHFALNSDKLHDYHKKLLSILASRIIAGKINVVVATGHTDNSGTDEYNDDLGYRRAANVVKELRNQLHLQVANSHRAIFWKIDSRGEKQPLQDGNDAANRRVEICVGSAGI